MQDMIWKNVNLLTMAPSTIGADNTYGLIENAAIAVKDGVISWIGRSEENEKNLPEAKETYDCHGAYMTPGLIDCHTHLIYGGSRIDEFEQRMTGVSYEEIAKSGGGIMSTVRATRKASKGELFSSAKKRLNQLMGSGVTTVEIKSGYGLDLETEIKMLEVAQELDDVSGIDVAATCLAAHALPPEFSQDRSAYIDLIVDQILPEVARRNLATAVDGFCESIGFTAAEMTRVFDKAQELGFKIKLHAEQLTDQAGAALAAEYGALSADHLEHLTEDSVRAMAKSGTVAVLLPGAFYSLRDEKNPPIELLRKYKVPMAVATDSNPGSSPVQSLALMINMASTLFRLTPEEALLGVTKHAAQALGLKDRGTLEVGRKADFALWDITHPASLSYMVGGNYCLFTVKEGVII
jgi:imidazolonepropionase